ncbi:hypothetical protein [Spongiimicrobium sp. 3-5]|uniref:hypothetical protein n=1 Tax=Spongiimicrobium sp. 3-5 TaxID=3332596 RepID=UPI003980C48D
MSVRKIVIAGLLNLVFVGHLFAQDSVRTAVAQQGDGIYSILRKQGIDPVAYYKDFIELNENNLRAGSQLYVGRTYFIPSVPESFKEMGLRLQLPQGTETPIFDKEVVHFIRKDSSLRNVVYYLISAGSATGETEKKNTGTSLHNDITQRLAKELLQRGAKVYLLEDFQLLSANAEDGETPEAGGAKTETLDAYIDAVNKRYLKHSGKYQRLLVIGENDGSQPSEIGVTIYHHEGSEEGKKLASNIQQMFEKRSIRQKYFKNYSEVFSDKDNLYFAKNTLPTMTYIEIGKHAKNGRTAFETAFSKKSLTDVIAKGILMDYSKLDFEDN